MIDDTVAELAELARIAANRQTADQLREERDQTIDRLITALDSFRVSRGDGPSFRALGAAIRSLGPKLTRLMRAIDRTGQ